MHNKKIIRICAHTLPFAAKIKDVAPINAAVNVNISISPVIIFEITTISNDPSHKINLFYTNFYQITRIYTIKEDSHISILHTYHDNINKKRRISMDRCCCNQPSEIKFMDIALAVSILCLLQCSMFLGSIGIRSIVQKRD